MTLSFPPYGTPEYFKWKARRRRIGRILILIGLPLLIAYGLGLIVILIGLAFLVETKKEKRERLVFEDEKIRQRARGSEPAQPAQPAQSIHTQTIVERVLIQCSHCGNRYPQGTTKCTNCGARL